jgi:hypothetical protein
VFPASAIASEFKLAFDHGMNMWLGRNRESLISPTRRAAFSSSLISVTRILYLRKGTGEGRDRALGFATLDGVEAF